MNRGFNTRAIGKDFEKEAFKFLKEKFDEVIWLSDKKNSTFDFKCIKNGKEYNVDAKCGESPTITYKQRNMDFLVTRTKNGIELWDRKRLNKIKPQGKGFKNISIRDVDDKKLEDYKIHPNQPMWEVIKKLLNKKEVAGNATNNQEVVEQIHKESVSGSNREVVGRIAHPPKPKKRFLRGKRK